MQPSTKGRTLAHYKLKESLGQGGWSLVYRAWDTRLERPVALKILNKAAADQETGRALFLQEARLAATLSHQHIAAIYEVGEEEGQAYIAMEYIDGLPLRDLIPEEGFSPDQVVFYASQLAAALAYAHGQGILHGDIKSSNILVTTAGEIKLIDFGLARRFRLDDLKDAANSRLPLRDLGPVAGTLTYAAPEVLQGKSSDARADIWAFGVLLFQMSTGKLPFEGATAFDLGVAIMTGEPGDLPTTIRAGLAATIHRCLEKEQARRYGSAYELLEDLNALKTSPLAPPPAIAAKRWRPWMLPAGLSLIAVLALVLLITVTRTLILSRQTQRGSGSPPQTSAAPAPVPPPRPENPEVKVWVNTKSGVYHCPGAKWYGKTKTGEYMTQAQAEKKGYRAALGKPCP